MDENEIEMDVETVVLTDDTGRKIACTVERFIEVEEQDYALLVPVDAPVEIFAWQGEEDDDEEAIPVESDEEIDALFPIAKAVLEEQNLTLKRTAVVLTVEGDLPDLEDEDEFIEITSETDEEDVEELQLLARFYHEEKEFAVYAPLDPFFILARMEANNQPRLLLPEELEKLQPLLAEIEDQIFDDLDSN